MNGSDADDPNTGGGAQERQVSGDAAATATSATESIIEPAVSGAVDTVSTAATAEVNGIERATRPDRLSSILVAVGPGAHTGATVDVAKAIAEATDAWLELFHVVPSDAALADDEHASDDGGSESETEYAGRGERLLSAAENRLGGFDRSDRWLVEDHTAAGAIVEQSPYYDLVVMGATTTGTVGRFVFGSTTDTVVDAAEVPVVVVEANGATALCDPPER